MRQAIWAAGQPLPMKPVGCAGIRLALAPPAARNRALRLHLSYDLLIWARVLEGGLTAER
jgi:hypothetical protein